MSSRPIVALYTTLVLALAGGCALSDALQGEPDDDRRFAECVPFTTDERGAECSDDLDGDCDGMTDCADPDCGTEPVCGGQACADEWLGDADLFTTRNTCGSDRDYDNLSQCGPPGNGSDMVFEFKAAQGGTHEICIHNSPAAQMFLSSSCGPSPSSMLCLWSGGCNVVDLTAGQRYFLYWQAETQGACGDVDIDIVWKGGGEQSCHDGIDDDDNGLIDCEDASCQSRGECDSRLGPEWCNGFDDGDTAGFGPWQVDEAACSCVTDSGCDDLPGTTGNLRCHTDLQTPNGWGVCAPDCRDEDWCTTFGGICDTFSGECKHDAAAIGEMCMDGADNDGDGRIDCEDADCQFTGDCQRSTGVEQCDGIDNGKQGSFPTGTTDESSCGCVSWTGCDDLDYSTSWLYICHDAVPGYGSMCNPPCDVFDWCADVGATCHTDGQCR